MSEISRYHCGTCGARGIAAYARANGGWQVECAVGHEIVPTPGFQILAVEVIAVQGEE